MQTASFLISTFAFFAFLRAWRNSLGFTFFGMTSFYVICILWVPYYIACNALANTNWTPPISDTDTLKISIIFSFSALLSILIKKTIRFNGSQKTIERLIEIASKRKINNYKATATVIASACIATLFLSKGVTLSVGNYGSRFESNTGTGAFSILSYTIVSVAIIRILQSPQKKTMLTSLAIVIFYGVSLFLTLGGARNYLISAVVPVLIISYSLSLIKTSQLIIYAIGASTAVTLLALIRYGDTVGTNSLELALLYTRDTIFPINSLSETLGNHQIQFVGFDFFFNQIYSAIPRLIWPEKPIYLDTIAYHFTEQVIGYGKGLIIAPTGIGSLYLMGGWTYISIGVPILFLIFCLTDYVIFNKKPILFIFIWPTLFFSFFCFRESFELGTYKIAIHSIGAIAVYAISAAAFKVIPRKSKKH